MRTTIAILCLLVALTSYSQLTNKLDSAQFFDFWVGSWQASWDEGDGVKPLGVNTITKTLDEKVIVENFRITSGQSKGFKGTSISVFQPRFNRWKQAWADNQGGYFDFTGTFEGEKRIFQTEVINKGDLQIQQRMVFYDIKPDTMTWDWELSKDGGQTWTLQWRIFYERIDS